MFWARSDQNSGFHGNRYLPLSYNGGVCCGHFIFDWIFFILGNNKDNHNFSDEFKFRLGLTSDCGVAPLSVWKNPHKLIMGKMLWPL